jgi:tetratricopeptide (TPR) repeat protein
MNFWNWIQNRISDFNKSSEADLAFRQGVYQRQQGNYDKALEFFTRALDLNPRHVSAYIYRGHVRRQTGDTEGARRDYDAAFRLDPFAAADWANMPLPNGPDSAHPTEAEFGGGPTETIPEGVQPSSYIRRGQDNLERNNLRHALEAFNKAIELSPNDPRAFEGRATAHFQAGNVQDALNDYDEAIRLNPANATNHINRGLMHYFNQNSDAAIEDFSHAIELNPAYAMAYNNRATVYRDQQDYEKALADYSLALDLEPRNPVTLLNRGDTYALMDDHYRALDDYNKAMYLDRDNPDVYLSRAKSRSANGDKMGAISDYRKFLDLGGADKHNNRAEIEQIIKDLRLK